ncbi:hypothetical protein MTO96_051675 [Rhipicephalus appendiculatus]
MSTTAATKRTKKLEATLPFDPTSSGPRGLSRYAKASLRGLLTVLKMSPTAAGDEQRCDLPRNATDEFHTTSATTIGDNYEAQSRTPSSQTFDDKDWEASPSAVAGHQSSFVGFNQVAGEVRIDAVDVGILRQPPQVLPEKGPSWRRTCWKYSPIQRLSWCSMCTGA